MPFEFSDTELRGLKAIKPEVFEDDRGLFMETYKREAFEEAGIDVGFIQDNFSKSTSNVLRGLHYQTGDAAQAKIVQCTAGKIFDVVVDLKKASPTFGEYTSTILSEENKLMLYVPREYAHGFLTLSDTAKVRYKVDNDYRPNREGGIIWDDPTLAIDWPSDDPILSEKDRNWPTLETAIENDLVF
ncbi:dTDP-4-dehydrorhamnose 3,5-epimerase or related enzyme [Halalkaliarchaeum sp. AArc-CO]|uniref:dTDP-4-dehydrorhamnose 3,5-epimerase n=1 Tax=Halalkaliarchaeum sp. AArc-CO TaxID=2866381 RepID=UPI00217E476E|nr:dTDP-4-dehydrorhamnose 3,5-epimerase [Halalkaliarchaeum sp. AArc-CO]UWG50165.1 dTDP-4-dehydrorhamnose 3,5-epimerase or related enzyme [Halalkaliarchaeum sp. AArc-CO]